MDNPSSENTADFLGGPLFRIPPSLKAKYQQGTYPFRVIKIRNLSRLGLSFEDTVLIPVGTTIKLILNLKNKKMEAQGQVTWKESENQFFIHGLKFTFLSQEAQKWFNTFVMDWAAEHLAENLDFSSLTAPPEVERRRFARLKIPLRVEVGFNPETLLIQTQILDISEGGLCLISNFELKKDQEVYLKLWISDQKSISLTGTIKYCMKKMFEKRQVNFHGVEFHGGQGTQEVVQFLEAKRAEFDLIELTLDEIISQTDFPELP